MDLHFGTEHRVFQGKLQVILQVGTAMRLRTAAATAATEDITEHIAEDVFETGATATRTAPHGGIDTGMTVLIVGGTFVGIIEYFVSLLGFLELGFRVLRIIGITVRVIFHRQSTIGLLQVCFADITRDTQYFVIISF
jgi:hypothetical protein